MRLIGLRFAFASLLVGPALGFGQNLLVNGSFEYGWDGSSSFLFTDGIYSIPHSSLLHGWEVSFGDVESVQLGYGGWWTVSDGSYSVDLNGWTQGGIQQVFATTPGQNYQVTFDLSGNSHSGTDFLTDVAINGASVGNFASTSATWATNSFKFVASGATTTLAFASTSAGDGGPAVDNVSVSAIPEPSTFAFVCGGAALAWVAFRRRRTRATKRNPGRG
jgi:hypothetical protein